MRELLRPFEYTRLDNIIDLMLVAAEEAVGDEVAIDNEVIDYNTEDGLIQQGGTIRKQVRTPNAILRELREQIIQQIEISNGIILPQRGRDVFSSRDERYRVVCTISKKYNPNIYWYAYHSYWDTFLGQSEGKGLFALG